MGGSFVDEDWEMCSSRNIVLVGRTGNGKSATGNNIIGKEAFKSKAKSGGVTSTCEMQNTTLSDGQILNVIDTPGLFDASVEAEFMGKEIVKCLDLAKEGIHAVVLVLTTRTRFTEEEKSVIGTLQELFGPKIVDYIVIVFTGGDILERSHETLEDYLDPDSQAIKDMISLCKGRVVLFDNLTEDKDKRSRQLEQLLTLINEVTIHNNGRPYTDKLFTELKMLQKGAKELEDQREEVNSLTGLTNQEILELKEQINTSYEKQLHRITEMVEEKLRETNTRLEKQLEAEQAARLKAQEIAQLAQNRSSDEIRILRQSLEKAQKETDELRQKAEQHRCNIL